MALLMWTHGEEALAKSLVACKLYKAMAHEAAEDDLDTEIYEELRSYAKEFESKGRRGRRDLIGLPHFVVFCQSRACLINDVALAHVVDLCGRPLIAHTFCFAVTGNKLLDFSYRQDAEKAQRLLTCELHSWSNQSCLSLAVAANHRALLAHPCSQVILADLWMGGLRTRKNTNFKVSRLSSFLILSCLLHLVN